MILIGGFDRAISPKRVETAAKNAPQNPPKSRTPAKYMRKDVEPFAATLSWVLRVSNSVAINTKVINGHQPGNGALTDQTATPDNTAVTVMDPTKSGILGSRGMKVGMGTPCLLKFLCPSRAVSAAD